MFKLILKIIFLITISTPSYSYLGPGISGGIIAATFGIFIAIFAFAFALLWFPLKKMIKNIKDKKKITKQNQISKID